MLSYYFLHSTFLDYLQITDIDGALLLGRLCVPKFNYFNLYSDRTFAVESWSDPKGTGTIGVTNYVFL